MPLPKHNCAKKQTVIVAAGDINGLVLVNLPHPKTKKSALFGFSDDPANGGAFEIISVSQEHGAWFIGNSVESDGRLMLVSPMDVLLLAIPYLKNAKRSVPLDHLLVDEDSTYSEALSRLGHLLMRSNLDLIANQIGSSDLNVWKFDEAKTMTYLAAKVERLSAALAATQEPASEQRKALEILGDYLQEDVFASLSRHLNLTDCSTPDSNSSEASPVQSRKRPLESETDDNEESKPRVKSFKGKNGVSSKQKSLAKSAAGSKSIMSFFAKK